jgi:hypothetical protein
MRKEILYAVFVVWNLLMCVYRIFGWQMVRKMVQYCFFSVLKSYITHFRNRRPENMA